HAPQNAFGVVLDVLVQVLDQTLNGVNHLGSNIASFPRVRDGLNRCPIKINGSRFDCHEIAGTLPGPNCTLELVGLVGKREALQIGDRPWREVLAGPDTYRS